MAFTQLSPILVPSAFLQFCFRVLSCLHEKATEALCLIQFQLSSDLLLFRSFWSDFALRRLEVSRRSTTLGSSWKSNRSQLAILGVFNVLFVLTINIIRNDEATNDTYATAFMINSRHLKLKPNL